MPGGDGTGPGGMGPMTGRAAGYCAGYNVPGYANSVGGRGFGFGGGFGGGRGRRNWYTATGMTGWQRAAAGYPAVGAPVNYAAGVPPVGYPTLSAQQEKDMLKAQADSLQQNLENIQARLDELNADKDSDE